MRISFPIFLVLVRFFADNISANDASRRLGVSYNTVYEVFQRLRSTIQTIDELQVPLTGRMTPAQSKKTGTQPAVFGIQLVDSRIVISQVTSPDPGIIISLPIPTMQRGNILFIDAYGKKFQGFITYIPDRHGREFVHIRARDGMPWSPLGNFWDLAGRTWTSHKGLHLEQIPAFVQELAFRYNHRDTDLFPVLLDRIAQTYA